LETVYREKKQTFMTERLFIEVPGSPDEPTLWLLDQKDNNAVIHWSEPRGNHSSLKVNNYKIVFSISLIFILNSLSNSTCIRLSSKILKRFEIKQIYFAIKLFFI
jgi:hypothetical protein